MVVDATVPEALSLSTQRSTTPARCFSGTLDDAPQTYCIGECLSEPSPHYPLQRSCFPIQALPLLLQQRGDWNQFQTFTVYQRLGIARKCEAHLTTGRANAGKSTLFNAVLGRKDLLHTSSKAGRTRELNFYRVGKEPGKLVLVDAPGYGARGKREWGQLFDGYLETRKELKRVYILFNAKHGLNEFDRQMLQHLSTFLISESGTQPFTLQSVIAKVDLVPPDQMARALARMKKEIFDAAPLCLPPILTSCEMNPPFGVEKFLFILTVPMSHRFLPTRNPQAAATLVDVVVRIVPSEGLLTEAADVFRFTFYWTLILYTPFFLACGAYAFWNYTFPPSATRRARARRRDTVSYEMVPTSSSYPAPSRYTGSNISPTTKLPKINEGRSRVTFATIVFFVFVVVSLAGSVLGSAVMGFVTFGLFKAGHFHMSTWIPFLLAVLQVLIGLLSVWPSIIEII
ncbi:hypothetical protein NMY22_g10448 [Coprinellus aureogranulatus]|nr:hypothetical protein NMY22_g10448 [Coprinellus aureogranulatus]